MTLEETITDLTSRTPSGGSCRIGDTSFVVWYCSDSWEWEYLGQTYYDPADLADAILRGGKPGSSDQYGVTTSGRPLDRRVLPRDPSVIRLRSPMP